MPIRKIITSTDIPIKIWTDDIEASAVEHAITIADCMPVHSRFALIPDVHPRQGYADWWRAAAI